MTPQEKYPVFMVTRLLHPGLLSDKWSLSSILFAVGRLCGSHSFVRIRNCPAAIWRLWKNPKIDKWERTFAVLTGTSNELMQPIHPRVDTLLEPRDYGLPPGFDNPN
jgi:hypothetical protein